MSSSLQTFTVAREQIGHHAGNFIEGTTVISIC
jgi:hypothetical protein